MILRSPPPPPAALITPEDLPVGRLPGCFIEFKELTNVRFHADPTQKPRDVLLPVYGLIVQGKPRFLVDHGMTASFARDAKLVSYLTMFFGGPPPEEFDSDRLIGEAVTVVIGLKTVTRDGKPTDRRWKHIEAVVHEPFASLGKFPSYELFEDAWLLLDGAGGIKSDHWVPA